jgi:hypothetical protein
MHFSGCGEKKFVPSLLRVGGRANQAFGRKSLDVNLQDKTTTHPQSKFHAPPHDPLEAFPRTNNTLHPHTLASTHDFIKITNAQDTRRRGGCQYFSTTITVPKLVFFHTPPFTPNYRKLPTRPPVLLIKVFAHPPLSPGLAMVSAKVVV